MRYKASVQSGGDPTRVSPLRRLGSGSSTPKSGFRPDIQGLRAVAVVLVVLCHARVPGLEGGFVGVDVFFVISGFLITGLLLAHASKNSRVGFGWFYARRARRILPAATLVIIATSIASVLILNFVQARSVLVDSVWAAFFGANIHFAREGTNYFTAATATVSPLQHYWSLSVEEQFYLVWPALLGLTAFGVRAFWRRRAREASAEPVALPIVRIAAVLVALGAVSLYLSIQQTSSDPYAAYFSTIDRAYELVIGALLAVALPLVRRIPDPVRAALSWLGLAGIAYVAVTYSAATRMPGTAALVPVLAAAAVIAGGVEAPRFSAVPMLSLRPFRLVGDVSYSLYLWHWPILILSASYFSFALSLWQRLVLVGVAFILSLFSYAFVEYPFQHAKRLINPSYRGLLLWPTATSIIVAFAILAEPGTQFALGAGPTANISAPAAVIQAVEAAEQDAPVPHRTSPSIEDAPDDQTKIGVCSGFGKARSELCEFGDPRGSKLMVVFGNSHAVMWIPALSAIAKKAHWKFIPVVKEACGYDTYARVPGLRGDGPRAQCVVWYDWARSVIERMHPNLVVIGVYAYRRWARGLQIIIPQLQPYTKRIVLISDAPGIAKIPAYCLAQPGATLRSCLWPESKLRITAYGTARNLAAANHVGFVNVESWFCYHRLCPSVINGLIPYADNGHLTKAYSKYLAPELGAQLNLAVEP